MKLKKLSISLKIQWTNIFKLLKWEKNNGISENIKNDEYRIFGCTSMAWVKVEKNEEKYYINTDSDTFIVKGLLSILKTLIDGSTIDEINSLDAESIFIDIGLKDSITSQRTNGFMNALKQFKNKLMENNFIKISRDCDGVLIPSGDSIKILKDSPVKITQSLGGYFTLYVNGNLVKLDGKDADAIGQKIEHNNKVNQKQEFDENLIWEQLKTCYDPEIPVNVVDLGLIYDLSYEQSKNEKFYVKIKMTLTAPDVGWDQLLQQMSNTKYNLFILLMTYLLN